MLYDIWQAFLAIIWYERVTTAWRLLADDALHCIFRFRPMGPDLKNTSMKILSFSSHSAAWRAYISTPDDFFEVDPMNLMSHLMSPVIWAFHEKF